VANAPQPTTPAATQTLLNARDIAARYGARQVVTGASIELRGGEVVALLGPNGAGKTTFMKVLVGLVPSANGGVDGPHRREIGWVPQGGATYQRLTVRENLELFARLAKLRGTSARAIAREAAHAAELDPWFERLAGELSGGLRQRLSVAVGLLGNPRVLVLDEPTTGVDLVHRTTLFRVLRERADTAGCSVLYSTHTLEDAASADRVVVFAGGRDVWNGQLADVAQFDEGADARSGRGLDDPVARGMLALWDNASGGE
jgi:ABC-2 type transport system ATP-binding protein